MPGNIELLYSLMHYVRPEHRPTLPFDLPPSVYIEMPVGPEADIKSLTFDVPAYITLLKDNGVHQLDVPLLDVTVLGASPDYHKQIRRLRGNRELLLRGTHRSNTNRQSEIRLYLFDMIDSAIRNELSLETVCNETLLHETGHYLDAYSRGDIVRTAVASGRKGVTTNAIRFGRTMNTPTGLDSLIPTGGLHPVVSAAVLGLVGLSKYVENSYCAGFLYRRSKTERIANEFMHDNAGTTIIRVEA